MSKIATLLKTCVSAPISLLMKSQVVPDKVADDLGIVGDKPVFYIIKTNSFSDRLAINRACINAGLPGLNQPVVLNGQEISALLCLENPKPVWFGKARKTKALEIGDMIFAAHHADKTLDAQLIPVTITYGRAPGKEKADLQSVIADSESPSWLRKLFMVLFSGRANFIRFSRPVSIRKMADRHGSVQESGHKLVRIARFHFYRQKLSATGPRLWSREQMTNSVMSAPAVIKAIGEEMAHSGNDRSAVKLAARKIIDEVAADYRESYVRLASRFLTWLWNKLYNGIKVSNAEVIRDLAQQGHEIIYVPCHRSHMDYLLLSYVIHNQGLVPPHIAAGINLNFGPVGPILRRGGAFFLRRSFKGDKLYAAIFNEYLTQLFMKGYSVKYFIEGGRSRTGRLLPPKAGMLAMTIEAMLRGVDRPVSFVPVYIGYEHVMEVNTYLKELRGSSKKSESLFGIFKALKNLRDYGYGYVNFGQPLSLKTFLNDQVPGWKADIDGSAATKPDWINPVAHSLATRIMTSINNTTALSATTLSATALLAAHKHTLTRDELESQLDLYLGFHRQAKYTGNVTVPDSDGKSLVSHLIKLKKVNVSSDSYGEVISLDPQESILMTYYRNNTIHLFALPSFIAAQLLTHERISAQQLTDTVALIYPLFKHEWFLDDLDVAAYGSLIVETLIGQGLIVQVDGMLTGPKRHSAERFRLQMLANIIRSTLQRYAIVLNLISHSRQLPREALETNSQIIAKRLSSMHGIRSPEFFDIKVLSTLITALGDNGHIMDDETGHLSASPTLAPLTQIVTESLQNDVVQSITQSIKKAAP